MTGQPDQHIPRIFLCHADEDKPRVRELYSQLKAAGYHPWLDREDLLPGQDWEAEIRKVISDPYNVVLVCLSNHSVSKRGVVQREIKWALDVLDRMPEEAIYLIPARLEACPVPERLSRLQWVDFFEPDGFERLRQALDREIGGRRAESAPAPVYKAPSVDRPLPLGAGPRAKSPLDYLRDPIWQALLTLIVIIALAWILYARYLEGSATPSPAPTPATPSPVPAAAQSPSPLCDSGVAPALETLDDTVLVPATSFTMGDNQGERPQHRVSVAAFWIDRFEVTNLQYRDFLSATGRLAPSSWDGLDYPPGQTAFQPVVNVTWQDARDYCAWAGKRLPSEAEWELACRGPDGRLYPWGSELDSQRANTLENSCGKAQMVGSYSPDGDSAYKAADLVGNVFEWVSSIAEPYPYRADSRENLQDTEAMRVVRGGSWQYPQEQGSCTVRSPFPPGAVFSDLGFRCATSDPPP